MLETKKFTLVSLFSGAGGLDIGFERSGFKTIWANDIDRDACETHRKWSDAEVVLGDISKIDLDSIPDANVIAGGFPCQGFSLAARQCVGLHTVYCSLSVVYLDAHHQRSSEESSPHRR
jgi:site-specific DNA-cytosine methylase